MADFTGVLGAFTGLVTVVLSLGIAFWALFLKHQRRRMQYDERRLMIERGLTPSEWSEPRKVVTPDDAMRRGLVQACLGVGLGIGYLVLSRPGVDGPPAWVAGLAGAVVGFLGLGHLAYYLLARRGRDDTRGTTDVAL